MLKRNAFESPIGSAPGIFLPSVRFNALAGRFECVDPVAPGAPRSAQPVPVGTRLVKDDGFIKTGAVAYKPKFTEATSPLGMTMPPLPAGVDPADWMDAVRTQVLIDGFGLRSLLITSQIVMNAFKAIYDMFSYHAEAQAGQVGVYLVREPTPVKLTAYKDQNFYAPVLELVGFIERDANLFGPRITRPPPPILQATAAPLPVPPPPPPANDDAAAAAPANDNAAAATLPVKPQPAAVDPFASYRPVRVANDTIGGDRIRY